jgi:hypothetical protein
VEPELLSSSIRIRNVSWSIGSGKVDASGSRVAAAAADPSLPISGETK